MVVGRESTRNVNSNTLVYGRFSGNSSRVDYAAWGTRRPDSLRICLLSTPITGKSPNFRKLGDHRPARSSSWTRKQKLASINHNATANLKSESALQPLARLGHFSKTNSNPIFTRRVYPKTITFALHGLVAELADAPDLGSGVHRTCRFDSCRAH